MSVGGIAPALRGGAMSMSIALALAGAACETEFREAPGMTAGSPAIGTSGVGAPVAGGAGMAVGTAGTTAPAAGTMGGVAGTAPTTAGTGAVAGTGAAAGTGSAGAGGMPPEGGAGMAAPDAGMEPEVQTCPATSTLQPGQTNETVQVGGVSRRFIQYVPRNYTGATPVPLVVDWHPILTSASFERSNSGYAAKAETEGFIVLFPEGIDTAWNVGQCCTSSRTVDDLGFARAMVDALEAKACIDVKRIHSVGYSMGGGMSMHVACNLADIFASVAPAAFELMEENEWPCHPSRPIAVIQFNGTADFIVPYGGGASNPPNGLAVTNHFLGAVGTSQKFAQLAGCSGEPSIAANGCNTYTQCGGGVEVALCTQQGGGHSSGDPDIAWDFLKRFPLP